LEIYLNGIKIILKFIEGEYPKKMQQKIWLYS